MSISTINVAILGSGPLADLIAKRIAARGLTLTGTVANTDAPPPETTCILYLPAHEKNAAIRISELLRDGFNVISTIPAESLDKTELLECCKIGGATYHGSGGFQNALIARFNRAFSCITRGISQVTLTEERSFKTLPEQPADVFSDYYAAGLHLLEEAVFGQDSADEKVNASSEHDPKNHAIDVHRGLGERVTYDSTWVKSEAEQAPLRYKLRTTSVDAIGHVSITFNDGDGISPADHLTSNSLVDAIEATATSAPGILRHDLEINHVMPDDRLS